MEVEQINEARMHIPLFICRFKCLIRGLLWIGIISIFAPCGYNHLQPFLIVTFEVNIFL